MHCYRKGQSHATEALRRSASHPQQSSTTHSKVVSPTLLSAQITSLALKLVPGHPSQWPDWILSVVTILSGGGAPPEYLLEFLEIAAEEYGSSDLVATSK